MSLMKLMTVNALELATNVGISYTSPAPGSEACPRLYDRQNNLLFTSANAETSRSITVNGAALATLDVSQVLIPAGHNMAAGDTITVKASSNGSSWTTLKEHTVLAGYGLIDITDFSAMGITPPVQRQYWSFDLVRGATALQMGEVFLGHPYTFERNPSRPDSGEALVFNIERDESRSGVTRVVQRGESRRRLSYVFPNTSATMKTAVVDGINALGGTKPFWLMDPYGVWVYVEVTEPIRAQEVSNGRWSFNLDVLEFLG